MKSAPSTDTAKRKAQLRGDVVRAAMRWYSDWKKATNGEGPNVSDGWQATDVTLYGACRR